MTAGHTAEALGTFFGSDAFPIDWQEGERELFWILNDLHCPNPVSPLFFDIGGWWLTCDHMFRRFGAPFASDWIAKITHTFTLDEFPDAYRTFVERIDGALKVVVQPDGAPA